MPVPDILETLMLACFSIGWYWSIFTMVLTGRPYGKSAAFVSFTVLGYVLGLTAQSLQWYGGGPLTYLLIMYAWNLGITLVDLCLLTVLTLRERRRDTGLVRPVVRAVSLQPRRGASTLERVV